MSDDNTSQANFLDITSTNLDFDWTIDFDAKLISGSVKHTLIAKKGGVTQVVCVPLASCWISRMLAELIR